MTKYYTKQTLQTKMKQLEEATGFPLELTSCNGKYLIQSEDGPDFGWAGYYHTVKELIIYADGFLAGVKFNEH